MKYLKAASVLLLAVVVFSGCGRKKDDSVILPPEQVLSGNTILAPQSVTLEANTVPLAPVAVPTTPVSEGYVADMAPVELPSAMVTDKPTGQQIQQALKNAGLYTGNIDGKLGPMSQRAIKEFQSKNGLTADGKVGPRTWGKLSAYLQ